MNRHFAVLFTFVLVFAGRLLAADTFLVENGQPRAQIVIAADPPHTTRLAAHELQTYLEKISGAKLPIVNEASPEFPVKIYVGRSAHTDRLKITTDGLKEGAYRIVSGNDWLTLIGDDTDFVPLEPWARNNTEIVNGKLQREWDNITGAKWGAPNWGLYKNRLSLPGEIGRPTAQTVTGKVEPLQLWSFDERGSFNAVNGFLRGLGVRWYLPGDLGEVVPSMKSIPLPRIDETVRPDFPVRQMNFRFATVGRETALWAMRLGLRDAHGLETAHGMETMTHRDEILRAHPEWFALYGGKRNNQPGQALNHLCYSNEELLRETIRYVCVQFDHDKTVIPSVMPPDGFTSMCQCELCKGKDTPERGTMGLLSDYVWEFTNRVAKEVRKTHPDRKITNDAYGIYTLPPLKIDKLEPNVLVFIVGGRQPIRSKPEQLEEARALRDAWAKKTDNPILVFENYPFTDRGWYLPAYFAHAIGSSINATKGRSLGEDISLTIRHDFDTVGIGFNHFLVYFTARMYWGGKDADVDALLREYCRLFYGPAENEIAAFFDYCETHWQEMEKDKTKIDTALELFSTAKAKVDAGSVYDRRLALIDEFLKGLRNKTQQLAQKRGPVPVLRLVGDATGLVVDGQLDDEYWQKCPVAATVRLRELQTGRVPAFGTSVRAGWQGNSVYFAIRCEEPTGDELNIGTTRKDDSATWYGDVVEILLETESHSYYQIAINPAGAVADLDRAAPSTAWFGWDAQAEIATKIGDGFWTAEVRIPVTDDENDPLHQVIGRKPTRSLPWHVNVCRQRTRANGTELSAFSPTGADNFHDVAKFAHFYDGNSYQFEAGEPEQGFYIAYRAAADHAARGKSAEALPAFIAAAGAKANDFQKSAALEQAAANARLLQKQDTAAELAARIPIEAVRKTAQMQNLLAQRKAAQVIEQFGHEDIQAWPFWTAGEAFAVRGRAHADTGDGKNAEADLIRALDFMTDGRTRGEVWVAIADNRAKNLRDNASALAGYQNALAVLPPSNAATNLRSAQRAAEILNGEGKHGEAEAVLRKVNLENLTGFWRGTMLLALGDTLKAAGRKEEARTTYQAVLSDAATQAHHRKAAQEAIEALK